MGDPQGKRFTALAMDTPGHSGDEATRFANELGEAVVQSGGRKTTYMRALWTELSCALPLGLGSQYKRTETNVLRICYGWRAELSDGAGHCHLWALR